MLTGDNRITAQAIASQAGITEIYADLLPGDKTGLSSKSKQRVAKWRWLAMASMTRLLTQADSGIAIGTGTDVAIASASVVVISGDPL